MSKAKDFSYPIARPDLPAQPMSAAPRDGTRILVEQLRIHPSLAHSKYDVVPARWHNNPPGTPIAGYWSLLHSSVMGKQDHQLLGWWPLP